MGTPPLCTLETPGPPCSASPTRYRSVCLRRPQRASARLSPRCPTPRHQRIRLTCGSTSLRGPGGPPGPALPTLHAHQQPEPGRDKFQDDKHRRVPGATHPSIRQPGEGGDPDCPQHHAHPLALARKPGWVLRLTWYAGCAPILHGCPLLCPCGSSARPPPTVRPAAVLSTSIPSVGRQQAEHGGAKGRTGARATAERRTREYLAERGRHTTGWFHRTVRAI